MSNAQLNAMLNSRMKTHLKDKPSDYLCDGDSADDKEIQDTADPNDDVVEDFGFSGSRNARGQVRLLQSKVESMSNAELNAMLNQRAKLQDKPSDYLCDGDSADDKEIQDTADPNDDVVEDFGFSGSRNARGQVRLLQSKVESMSNAELNAMLNQRAKLQDKPSDYLCDGDSADDKEIQDTADPNDDVVEDFGFSGSRNARGQVRLLQSKVESMSNAELNAMLNQKHRQIWDSSVKYSDQLANGDRDDDKENQVEHDPNDPIVDYNGHTNYGYGHTEYDDPKAFWKFDNAHYADNNIKGLFSEHFGTVPRADFVQLLD